MLLPRYKLMTISIVLCLWQVMEVDCRWQNNHASSSRYRFESQQQQQQSAATDVKDKIIELQCRAKCQRAYAPADCRDQCKIEVMKSPRCGSCPNMQNSIFDSVSALQKLSCLDNCSYDFDCPEVQKCCQSSCGPVCTDGLGVREDVLLPPIPKILKYKLPRGHKVEITIQFTENSTYYYHVEARSHIGLLFSARKLGMWEWQAVELIAETTDKSMRSKRTDISFNLRPGRWYQVRVAAINANGFRGYSEPSKAFTLSNHPKPPKPPADLKVVSANLNQGRYGVKIVWCPSKSNLPIEKYKIIWSLYVKSKDESLISNEAYVKDTHQFEIPKLLPDSSYYIQVQAMSISGSRRLKSEKFSILYNTTALNEAYTTLKCSQQQQVYQQDYNDNDPNEMKQNTTTGNGDILKTAKSATYEVRFRLNRKFGMIVLISGFYPHREKVYELCPKETNCEQREYSAIRAKKDSLEFSKLKYNTTYMLKAFKANNEGSDGTGAFTFTTPKCENFRKRFPKIQINC